MIEMLPPISPDADPFLQCDFPEPVVLPSLAEPPRDLPPPVVAPRPEPVDLVVVPGRRSLWTRARRWL